MRWIGWLAAFGFIASALAYTATYLPVLSSLAERVLVLIVPLAFVVFFLFVATASNFYLEHIDELQADPLSFWPAVLAPAPGWAIALTAAVAGLAFVNGVLYLFVLRADSSELGIVRAIVGIFSLFCLVPVVYFLSGRRHLDIHY